MNNELAGKKIILCITGSIAAYKSAFLVRLLIKAKAEVRVVMTPSACSFITPLTISTLSKNKVHTNVSDGESWDNHVELGLWADLMLIAPATATTIGKLANGIADNMVVATYLSAKCPVYIAPAMDLDMWAHPSTKRNLELLQSYGNTIIPVESGELASGLVGDGRMAEPENILQFLSNQLHSTFELAGKKITVTAGPTYEAIDPVRFIGNKSSGKMGVSIALECAKRGAMVDLVLGPSSININHPNISVTKVISAHDMFNATVNKFDHCHATIMAAAVADYTPAQVADQKIKKQDDDLSIQLKRTQDISKHLGSIKKDQKLIGFALETQNEIVNAIQKIHKKNFDFIVLNSLNDEGAGFQHDTNKIKIIDKNENILEFDLKSKTEVAVDIVDQLCKIL